MCVCAGCACVQKQLKHAHSHWKAAAEAATPAEEVVKVARAPAYFVNYTKTKRINKLREREKLRIN